MTTSFHDYSQVESARSQASQTNPHAMEFEVTRRLRQLPDLDIKSLVVRRTPSGVCLEGRVETSAVEEIDLPGLMRGIPGLHEVINHLVISHLVPRPEIDRSE